MPKKPNKISAITDSATSRRTTTGHVAAGLSKRDLVAEALSNEILGGKYRVGDLLPSEPQLSLRFGISRSTVRAALQALQRLGLVSSRQGVGSQVQETQVRSRYTHSFNSAEDLLQYATTTRVHILEHTQVEVDAAMAAQFGCKPGEHWWRIRTIRLAPANRTVVAYSEIYIPLVFGAVLEEAVQGREPVFALIERRFNQTIVEIQQDITCLGGLSPEEAEYLQVGCDSPAMKITRRYTGAQGRVLEVAYSLHPSEVFKYSMRVQLRHGNDAA